VGKKVARSLYGGGQMLIDPLGIFSRRSIKEIFGEAKATHLILALTFMIIQRFPNQPRPELH
jgi:hypothetical protein